MDLYKKNNIYSIKKNIFRYFFLGMGVIGGVYFATIFWMYQEQDTIRHQEWEVMIATVFHHHIEASTKNLEVILRILSRNPALQQHFLAKDRPALLEETRAFGSLLNQDYDITHFYFHTLEMENFLRVHRPNLYGDTIHRLTLRQAAKNGITSGLELGPLGTLTLRVVMPWYVEQKRIGYLELGMELSNMLTIFEQFDNIDGYLLTADKKHIDQQGWEQGMAMLGRPTNWSALPDNVVLFDKLPKKFKHHDQKGYKGFLHKALPYMVSFHMTYNQPITDLSGQQIGNLLLAHDELKQLLLARKVTNIFLL
ncbi:MAG: hypothetical protein D3923_16480, partial [Candidatus Electrothrix sp. AR3]|nr:hypothetical protein [Candidatus Electrothrix sp. AR3]